MVKRAAMNKMLLTLNLCLVAALLSCIYLVSTKEVERVCEVNEIAQIARHLGSGDHRWVDFTDYLLKHHLKGEEYLLARCPYLPK